MAATATVSTRAQVNKRRDTASTRTLISSVALNRRRGKITTGSC